MILKKNEYGRFYFQYKNIGSSLVLSDKIYTPNKQENPIYLFTDEYIHVLLQIVKDNTKLSSYFIETYIRKQIDGKLTLMKKQV